MTILERKAFISSNPRIVLSSCPPPCGHFSIQESATGGLSYKVKKICTNVQIYRIALTKLIIVPLVVLLFLWIAPFNADIAYPTLIASACPTGTTITMMSIRFDKNATYASEIFSFTTVLSIITIPLIIFIAGFLL